MLTKGKLVLIPNLVEEAAMLEWAGIDFGEQETYKLSKSIKVRQGAIFIFCLEIGLNVGCFAPPVLGQSLRHLARLPHCRRNSR